MILWTDQIVVKDWKLCPAPTMEAPTTEAPTMAAPTMEAPTTALASRMCIYTYLYRQPMILWTDQIVVKDWKLCPHKHAELLWTP